MRTHCVAAATSTVSPRLSTTDEAVALEGGMCERKVKSGAGWAGLSAG